MLKKRGKALTLLSISIGLTYSTLGSGATVDVTSNLDDGTNCTLREAVETINSGVDVNGCVAQGVFQVDDTVRVPLALAGSKVTLFSEIRPTRNLTINASEAVNFEIEQSVSSSHRAFFVENISLTINGLVISDFTTRSIEPDAIEVNNGTLIIQNSKLIDNRSTIEGAAIVAIDGSEVTISDSVISGNISSGRGSAINARDSTINITNTALNNNYSAGDNGVGGGGAIWVRGSLINITDSLLDNNICHFGRGGAIFVDQASELRVKRSTFSENSAGGDVFRFSSSGDGGAISTVGAFPSVAGTGVYLGIENSRFFNNSAGRFGGGALSLGSSTFANISNTTLRNNVAEAAGAISTDVTFLTIRNSTISNNSATSLGGAGAIRAGYSQLSLKNSTISGNFSSGGAAIHSVQNTTIGITNSIVANSSGADCVLTPPFIENYPKGMVTSDTVSIIEEDSCNTVARQIDPRLSELADNGGDALTHALISLSPARSTGDLSRCEALDQRGQLRNNGDQSCDIGAVEYNANDVENEVEDNKTIFHVLKLKNGKFLVVPN